MERLRDSKLHRSILLSGAGYGGGLAAGSLLAYSLLNNQAIRFFLSWLDKLQLFLYLIFAIGLFVIIIGLGGGIGGAIGGWIMSGANELGNRRRFAWRSALSFFITHILVILPLILVTTVVGFLNQDLATTFSRLPSLFGTYGLVYGAVVGLFLGLLTVGLRRMVRPFIASFLGFGAGGWLMGAGLYLFSQIEDPGRFISFLLVTLILLIFGAVGGGALGAGAYFVHDIHPLIPQTRTWRILRNIALILISLYFLFAFSRLVNLLTIRIPDFAKTLALPTIATHWQPEDAVDQAVLNPGVMPDLQRTDETNGIFFNCTADGQIEITNSGALLHAIASPRCSGAPSGAQDGKGSWHVTWYSDETTKVTGAEGSGHFIYETIGKGENWSEPAIIGKPSSLAHPVLSSTADGSVLLLWDDQSGQLAQVYIPYNCDGESLTPLGEVMYAAVRQEKFRPANDPIPYCKNRFEQLLFTPNPTNPNSELPKPEYGAFDQVADMVREAEYEVLFTTMQWDKPNGTTSPGLTLTTAVADLYERVKANPENYPRGMTVRILLGNVPESAVFEATSQIINVLDDLRTAGIDEMNNQEIGWNLEVANFGGAWPHAHSKFVVVDGKTAMAGGFNYSYLHLPKEHPSGLGLDMSDFGIQITGPMAQSVVAAYDDLWSGSDLYTCSTFPPPIPSFWFLWCDISPAEADHVPEVLRFYQTDGDANAFALHHTMIFLEADEAIVDTLLAAEGSIDLFEVNFSLDLVCIISGLLGGLCENRELAPPYMQALLDAAVEKDVKIRVLAEPSAMNGLENRIAINWMQEQLDKAGKSDNVELRFYDGKMHDKALLIDNQMLIIGSQNFHWSAWDTPSLTEYNIATEDSEAIFDFQEDFEYQWEKGTPWSSVRD